MTKAQIIADIKGHFQGSDATHWSDIYVGISKDAKDRLTNGHGVKEWYIYRQADSSDDAREVEAYFINTLGADGGPGGGDDTADFVYAYKKNSQTRP